MKKIHYIMALAAMFFMLPSCSDFLERDADKIFTEDQIFGDEVMLKSVLSDMYGSVSWGQHVADWGRYQRIDEGERCDGGPEQKSDFDYDRPSDNPWRVYDYGYIRRANIFLKSLRATTIITAADKTRIEGEIRFLRAWTYFNMARSLGGMPIIGDEIFAYTSGMDVTPMQYARSTEAELYDYIISECQAVYNMLPADKNVNSARANKWTAKMLEARAAVYAASLANYNNKMTNPIRTSGGEVGIPADMAQSYYTKALAAATDVINNSPYGLQKASGEIDHQKLADNFYAAVSIKDGNTEVIWSRDYFSPGTTHGFTTANAPKSHREDTEDSWLGIILNLVEEFEIIETSTPGQGSPIISREGNDYKFYSSAKEPFEERDPRLRGTILYPGSSFKGREVVLQAGQLNKSSGDWVKRVSSESGKNEYDTDGVLITSENGPRTNNEQFINKTGFLTRKFLDETTQSGTRGRGSEMWFPRFRMSEAYLIAAEASFELNNGRAAEFINPVRERAGVKPLSTVTFNNIVHERRVEFVLEDHRFWDMRRWRLADGTWDGNNNNPISRRRVLFPYLVVAPGDPNDKKWAFEEFMSPMTPNAINFQLKNYYVFLDQDWINNNPKLVKNPYQ